MVGWPWPIYLVLTIAHVARVMKPYWVIWLHCCEVHIMLFLLVCRKCARGNRCLYPYYLIAYCYSPITSPFINDFPMTTLFDHLTHHGTHQGICDPHSSWSQDAKPWCQLVKHTDSPWCWASKDRMLELTLSKNGNLDLDSLIQVFCLFSHGWIDG